MSFHITPTTTEGEEEFDFEQWIKKNELEEVKALLIKHEMIAPDSISMHSKSFIDLMGELSVSKPLFVTKVLSAVQSLSFSVQQKQKNDSKPKHIIVSEEEHEVINCIESNLKEMNEIEININLLGEELPKSIKKIKDEKLTQIENTKKKIIDTYDSIKEILIQSQHNITNDLLNIESNITKESNDDDGKEYQILKDSTKQLNVERNNLTDKLQLCHHKIESMGNNVRKKRKNEIINIGNDVQKQFADAKQTLVDNVKQVKTAINENNSCIIEINYITNEKYKKTILNGIQNMGKIINKQYNPSTDIQNEIKQDEDEDEIIVKKLRNQIEKLTKDLERQCNQSKQLENKLRDERNLKYNLKQELQNKVRRKNSEYEALTNRFRQKNDEYEALRKKSNNTLLQKNRKIESLSKQLQEEKELSSRWRNRKKTNDEGREVKKSWNGNYYCGTKYYDDDGCCGPDKIDRQCASCKRYESY